MADDRRLEDIKNKLAARREATAASKAEAAARQAAANERAVEAATCWASQQMMMHSVADEINQALDADDPKLNLEFAPHGSGWLGRGEVKFGRRLPGMVFAVATSGEAEVSYHTAEGRAVSPEMDIVDLTRERWREILYDFMDSQL